MNAPDLSLVIPVRDEVDNLNPLWTELRTVLEGLSEGFEVVFADDGSRDGSGEALDRLSAADARIRVLHLDRRAGQTAALEAGFLAARGRVVITMDSDLQNDPGDIPRLLERMGSLDALVGYRASRQDSWLRRVSSRIANAVRNRVTGEAIIDTGCSLKAIRRECLERIRLYDGMHRFLPTLLRMEGFTVGQVAVGHRPRVGGISKYGLHTRLIRACCDLLAVRWMMKRRLSYRILGRPSEFTAEERSSRAG